MPSTKEYLSYILDSLSHIEDITYKKMYKLVSPYPNAKKMVEIDKIEDREYIKKIFNFLYETLT